MTAELIKPGPEGDGNTQITQRTRPTDAERILSTPDINYPRPKGGGTTSTPARVKAARANGVLGGRPKGAKNKIQRIKEPVKMIPIPEDMPQNLSVDNIPEALAKLDKRSQMIIVSLAAGNRVCDIAQLCNCDPSAIQNWITRHGLRELVSYVTPAHVTAFRAARWAQIEQSAVTRAASKINETSAMQAATIAAIASDKIERIHAQGQGQDGRDSGDILVSIRARLHR
jgi:hypothetical protein